MAMVHATVTWAEPSAHAEPSSHITTRRSMVSPTEGVRPHSGQADPNESSVTGLCRQTFENRKWPLPERHLSAIS